MASGEEDRDSSDAAESADSAPDSSRADVRRTFDRIAGHFSQTREYPWPEVEAFVADRTAGERVGTALDLGCGNGRHAELLAACADRVVGVDASRELLREADLRALDRGFDGSLALLQGDAARLPIADDRVALAVYVATLHHLPSEAARRASLDELARVLAPGGRALVSTWSTAHERFGGDGTAATRESGFDTTIDWTLPGGEAVPRFYHIYAPAEFREVLAESALSVVAFDVSSGNCYAEVTV